MSNKRQIYVNVSVSDLKRSMEFFTRLGFGFNPKFTDSNAACMIVNDAAFVMLLVEPFFKGFIKKEICNTGTHLEALLAVSCDSRAAVDELVDTALASGGTKATDPMDHGFMYLRTFYDLDGHHWEAVWMDPNAEIPKQE